MEEKEAKDKLASLPVNQAPCQESQENKASSQGMAKRSCGCGEDAKAKGTNAPQYVYALGKIEPRFRSMAVEREFVQATGRAETTGLTDQQAFYSVLSKKENRYLVRDLCWTLAIEGVAAYILLPKDPLDFDRLVESVKPQQDKAGIDVVVGSKGPVALPEMCAGLQVPIVGFDQLFSFNREEFIRSIPRPESIPEKQEEKFRAAANELFDRILQMADNTGATDEHRALNYLAVRYPAIYANAAEEFERNFSLTGVEARPSRLSGERKIVSVIFSYTNRETDVTEKFFVRVDVSEEFPFMVTKMAPYYDR
ncbi:cyanobactin maturation protease PatG family protein [Methanothrix soehngenii]|jgi:hypothetical protein|uniref:Uncharacterized protein n=1 Tax=Methanothrix soehngenii (strain ATCC 5969 / DSM 3671 / JCM 10134 / NBRC 103675 / OCM 69 / GP-6) TaxID=990316 RepID=F4BXL5_METSG|nr:hypothetical protein [Methanothrix soehngenii]AEB68693.1 conserved hypothetical protein [Methanothrix soehngenii GP6]